MIDLTELTRRLSIASRALSHAHMAALTRREFDDIHSARADVLRVSNAELLARAHRHLHEHQGGYPAGGLAGRSGHGTVSDPVGASIIAKRPDPVTTDMADLDTRTGRLQISAVLLLKPNTQRPDLIRLVRLISGDAEQIRNILIRWARLPDVRWCKHCFDTNRHREPVTGSRYQDVCRRCGDWRGVNSVLPQEEILRYLQLRQPVPQALLDRFGAKVPKLTGRRSKKKTRKAATSAWQK